VFYNNRKQITSNKMRYVAVVLLLGFFGLCVINAQAKNNLNQWLSQAKSNIYLPYDEASSEHNAAWLSPLLAGNEDDKNVVALLNGSGWQIKKFGLFRKFVALRDDKKRGWGEFVWKKRQNRQQVWLQTPHAEHDKWSGEIAFSMLLESQYIVGYASSSAPRYASENYGDSDLAHAELSFFRDFNIQLLHSFPQSRIVQLHGFAKKKRLSESASVADIIVSSGSSQASAYAKRVTDCLVAKNMNAKLYTVDVGELGGTTNISAKDARQAKHKRFLHIELSDVVRVQLKDEQYLRKEFIQCIAH
jgi:hypothetical protein